MTKKPRDLGPGERRAWNDWRNTAVPLRSRPESVRSEPDSSHWELKGSTPEDWDGDRRAAKILKNRLPPQRSKPVAAPERPGALSPEDQAEWDRYKRTAKQYEHRPTSIRSERVAAPPVRPRTAPKPEAASKSRAGPKPEAVPALQVPTKVEVVRKSKSTKKFRAEEKARMSFAANANPTAPGMDAGKYRKMTRGKLTPDDQLDLHGLTVAEAYKEVVKFVLGAGRSGARLLLIVTGKGREGPTDLTEDAGVLRRQVPFWLRQQPLKQLILDTEKAHHSQGGTGALYVYLKRKK